MTIRFPKARKMGFTLLLFSMFVAPGCCVHEPAIKAADRGIAGTSNHMANESLPKTTREVATFCHDTYWQIKFSLDGTKIPAAVQARKDARDAEAAERAGDTQ